MSGTAAGRDRDYSFGLAEGIATAPGIMSQVIQRFRVAHRKRLYQRRKPYR